MAEISSFNCRMGCHLCEFERWTLPEKVDRVCIVRYNTTLLSNITYIALKIRAFVRHQKLWISLLVLSKPEPQLIDKYGLVHEASCNHQFARWCADLQKNARKKSRAMISYLSTLIIIPRKFVTIERYSCDLSSMLATPSPNTSIALQQLKIPAMICCQAVLCGEINNCIEWELSKRYHWFIVEMNHISMRWHKRPLTIPVWTLVL